MPINEDLISPSPSNHGQVILLYSYGTIFKDILIIYDRYGLYLDHFNAKSTGTGIKSSPKKENNQNLMHLILDKQQLLFGGV